MRVLAALAGVALVLACTAEGGQVDAGRATTPEAEAPAPAGPAAAAESAAPGEAPSDSVLYLDVRTPEEFRTGHVQGAVLVPHDQVDQRWQELAAYRDRPVVVYCRSGRRSGIAIDVLRRHGFTNLTNGGGVADMAARGYPVVPGN